MTVYHVVMIAAAVFTVAYSIWAMGHMVADEIRQTIRGDVTTEVWMRAEDPRHRLVPVVDRDGRYIAVRPDKTDGWEDSAR